MTLLHLSAAVPAWCAVLFRLWLTYRLPQQAWRRSFTLAMILAAAGYTAWGIPSGMFGTLPGVFGPEGLLGSLGLMTAAVALHWYVSNLRHDSPSLRTIGGRSVFGLSGCLVLLAVFPFAEYAVSGDPLPDVTGNYANLAAHWVYACVFTLSLAEAAMLCLGRSGYRTQADRSGRVGVALVGWGCAVIAGITVVGLFFWTYDFFSTDLTGVFRHFDFLQPVAMWLLSAGVLVAGAGHYVGRWRRARRVQRLLGPLWRDLTARCPEVVLLPPTVSSPLRRSEMGAERVRVEIRDALERLCLSSTTLGTHSAPGGNSVAAVAQVLRHDADVSGSRSTAPCILAVCPPGSCCTQTHLFGEGVGGDVVPVGRLLPDVSDRDAALQQLVGLAREYQPR